jgi:hypothetical protein
MIYSRFGPPLGAGTSRTGGWYNAPVTLTWTVTDPGSPSSGTVVATANCVYNPSTSGYSCAVKLPRLPGAYTLTAQELVSPGLYAPLQNAQAVVDGNPMTITAG